MEPAEAFLLDQFPLAVRSKIPTTLKVAYDAASRIIAAEPVLQTKSAEDNAGRIVQWAVDFGFERLINSGGWPFEARWQQFARPTGRYLEIVASHSVLTISQSQDTKRQPRNAVFRSNKRVNNQKGLFDHETPPSTTGLIHVLLLHGYQQLHFAQLGIPHEQRSLGYHFITPNLMNLPHLIAAPEPPMEDTDIEAVMTLKEEIDRWRRDNE